MNNRKLTPYGLKGALLRFSPSIFVISGLCDFVRESYTKDHVLKSITFPESSGGIIVGHKFQGQRVRYIKPITDACTEQQKGIHSYVIAVEDYVEKRNQEEKTSDKIRVYPIRDRN